MQTSDDFSPSRNFNCWLKVDYATLLSNIRAHRQRARLLDITAPFLFKIWAHLEDDLLRAGIEGVLSDDPVALLTIGPSLKRILKPGFKSGEIGYAREGLLPVLGSFSECLSLSNMAQMLDQRLRFFLRVRSTVGEYGAGDWGLDSICEQMNSLPMLDLAGFYLHKQLKTVETGILRRHLRQLGSEQAIIMQPLTVSTTENKEFRPYISWESVALENESQGCFPIEIGFWAFPVHSGTDFQIFQADLGRLHGLPESFPAQIAGQTARILDIRPECSEFIIEGHFHGPYPVRGCLTGGNPHEPIDLRQWQIADLKNLLGHLKNCPVYLQKQGKIIEQFV